ncbi:MAG: hypothetical protein IID43_05665 [Planctomycetes bacterium]|nr:hypothetical protein [Planctomycetota bacterium]
MRAAFDRKKRSEPRPTGQVEPAHERAVKAMRALDDNRLADMATHIAAIPDVPALNQAWKRYLQGRLAALKLDFQAATSLLSEAFTAANEAIGTLSGKEKLDAYRLATRSWLHGGWICRRQDQPRDAYRTHLCVYCLVADHGSYEELWEVTTELGLDAELDRQHVRAVRWHRRAIVAGRKASQDPWEKEAIAWVNLSRSSTESSRHAEAVVAARRACECWRRHDAGVLRAAQADLNLGAALVSHGQWLHDRADEPAGPILDEAVACLTCAREALLAFGAVAAADAESCADRLDFAERLRASMEG